MFEGVYVGPGTIFSAPQRTFLFLSLLIWVSMIFANYGIMMAAGSWGDLYISSFIACNDSINLKHFKIQIYFDNVSDIENENCYC